MKAIDDPADPPATSKTRTGRRICQVLAAGILLCVVQVLGCRIIDPPFTVPMVWRFCLRPFSSQPYHPVRFAWRPLNAISVHLRRAVIAAEDQRFVAHNGFDWVEMENALDDMARDGRVRGASTISMQTARSLFLPPWRNVVRKVLEAGYTVLIEAFWDKRRILEVYLNTVDWGDGLYGAQAAAQHYFQVSADRLSRDQAALLAAILPNPHAWSPVRPGPYVRQRIHKILRDMPRVAVP